MDYYEDAADACIVMDYMKGVTLAELLEDSPVYDWPIIRKWLVELLEVLLFLHAQPTPIVHGDIKPSNIMLTEESGLVLVDFGAALLEDVVSNRDLQLTPAYAAPERLAGRVDIRSDVYAFGRLLRELLRVYRSKDPRLYYVAWKCCRRDCEKRYKNCQSIKAVLQSRTREEKNTGRKSLFCAVVVLLLLVLPIMKGATTEQSAISHPLNEATYIKEYTKQNQRIIELMEHGMLKEADQETCVKLLADTEVLHKKMSSRTYKERVLYSMLLLNQLLKRYDRAAALYELLMISQPFPSAYCYEYAHMVLRIGKDKAQADRLVRYGHSREADNY